MDVDYSYPSQQITEIVEKIDPVLVDFFNSFRTFYRFQIQDLYELAVSLLNEIGSLSSADMKAEYERERSNRKNKRVSWAKRIIGNSTEYDPSDPLSFFHQEAEHILFDHNYGLTRYGSFQIDDMVAGILSNLSAWRSKGDFLIKCPLFPNVGRVNTYETFKSDLKFDIIGIIQREYRGNIKTWGVSTPLDFVNNNIYSAQKGTSETEEINNQILASMYKSDHYDVHMLVEQEANSKVEVKLPIVDELDREIVSYLLNNIVVDLKKTSYGEKHQRTTLSDIATYVYHTNKCSAQQRDNIKNRLYHLMNPIEINNQITNEEFKWVLLQSVKISDINDHGSKEVVYILGDVLYDAVIQKRLISVPSSRYHELKDNYAKSLYHILQMERISITTRNESLIQNYSIAFFVQSMLLRYKTPAKNKKIIVEALNEVKKKSGIITEYQVKGTSFTIQYTPLSDDEKKDYIGSNETFQLGNEIRSSRNLIDE